MSRPGETPAGGELPVVRTRLAVGLVSLAVIGLELAMMRVLSVRFWHHLAYMVISVALLGFGASGTALTLVRGRVVRRRRAWTFGFILALAISIPLTAIAKRSVPVNVQFMAWDISQAWGVFALQLLMFAPFLLAGAVIGVVLTDRPERLGGHYGANLAGSGAGGLTAVALMYALGGEQMLWVMAGICYAAAVLAAPWRRASVAVLVVAGGAALAVLIYFAPQEAVVSQYKTLSYLKSMPDTRVIYSEPGPLGRVDVVEGPSIHHTPGLSLQFTGEIPRHRLIVTDGSQTSPVYDCDRPGQWRFADYTPQAAAYHLRTARRACIVGAGGGSGIGLAVYHDTPDITAIEINPDLIEAMRGPLADVGGDIYDRPSVEVVNQPARGYFAAGRKKFDVISVTSISGPGASGAGLLAAQESYLYTVESFSKMLGRLTDGGVLSVTCSANTPPRDGLKIFDLAAQAARRAGRNPARCTMMIRNWAAVTVLASNRPFTPRQIHNLERFCDKRSFDMCYAPGMEASAANRYHLLDRPYYFRAAESLLGERRSEFLDEYLFDVSAPTDDRPYFHHFFRWETLETIREQLKGRSRAFVEIGYVLLLAALVQIVPLAAVLIVLPLAFRAGGLRGAGGRSATLGYFLLLGAGFMLLEMGFLQKFILYLAHPTYSAGVVIAGFLVFGGLGSYLSGRCRAAPVRVTTIAAAVVVALSAAYLLVLEDWLAMSQAAALPARIVIAAGTIAPLALAMGHMFPAGLRQVSAAAGALVPWAWAVNGFASVTATVLAPLLGMHLGFRWVLIIALACYALAGVVGRLLPRTPKPLQM